MEILAKLASVTKLKQVYQTWDVRVVIMVSLFLQVFLILSAPFRKRISYSFIMVPMWLSYLLADAAATFGIGLISSSTSDLSSRQELSRPCLSSTSSDRNTAVLLAFWTPFLLLHLGGPDTITAFALEDNELWLRHLLQLGFHSGTCFYVLFIALPGNNKMMLPTFLMLFAGLIKYVERNRCLFLASSSRFQQTSLGNPDPGPSYDKLVDYFSHKKQANIPTQAETIARRTSRLPNRGKKAVKSLDDLEVVLNAHRFYRGSKGLIADLVLNFDERNDSRLFFQNRTPRDAFRLVEVELNFFYDILYTKAVLVHSKYGYALRFASFSSSVASLVLFYFLDGKQGFHNFDVYVTYSLLVGAIFLESVALVIVLLSDWTAVYLSGPDHPSDHPSLVTKILAKILNVNRVRWPKEEDHSVFLLPFVWFIRVIRRRWSASISQYNLIEYCLNPRSQFWESFIGFFGLTIFLDGMTYVETEKCNDNLRNFIFEELKMKSELADDLETARDLYTAKGDWVLRFEDHTKLLTWITEVDFDESLLLWHIATELCFQTETEKGELCGLAKILSDYMLYLLIIKSPILSSVAGIAHIRFRDTCAEAKRFFYEKNELDGSKKMGKSQTETCLKILKVETEFRPGSVKGDSSKSVLFDGCILAKELQKLKDGKWEIICKVWVEMLCYAACRCKGSTHAEQLGKGGQLITLVWMLMSHLGLGNQFQISDFQPRTVLTVAK